jgi:hypothetical protein
MYVREAEWVGVGCGRREGREEGRREGNTDYHGITEQAK